MHMLVERQTVSAAHEFDSMAAKDLQELGLVASEPPVLVRRVTAIEVGPHVHQHDPVRLIRTAQRGLEEMKVFFTRALNRLRRLPVVMPPRASRGVDRNEPRVAEPELEVHRPVNLLQSAQPVGSSRSWFPTTQMFGIRSASTRRK